MNLPRALEAKVEQMNSTITKAPSCEQKSAAQVRELFVSNISALSQIASGKCQLRKLLDTFEELRAISEVNGSSCIILEDPKLAEAFAELIFIPKSGHLHKCLLLGLADFSPEMKTIVGRYWASKYTAFRGRSREEKAPLVEAMQPILLADKEHCFGFLAVAAKVAIVVLVNWIRDILDQMAWESSPRAEEGLKQSFTALRILVINMSSPQIEECKEELEIAICLIHRILKSASDSNLLFLSSRALFRICTHGIEYPYTYIISILEMCFGSGSKAQQRLQESQEVRGEKEFYFLQIADTIKDLSLNGSILVLRGSIEEIGIIKWLSMLSSLRNVNKKEGAAAFLLDLNDILRQKCSSVVSIECIQIMQCILECFDQEESASLPGSKNSIESWLKAEQQQTLFLSMVPLLNHSSYLASKLAQEFLKSLLRENKKNKGSPSLSEIVLGHSERMKEDDRAKYWCNLIVLEAEGPTFVLKRLPKLVSNAISAMARSLAVRGPASHMLKRIWNSIRVEGHLNKSTKGKDSEFLLDEDISNSILQDLIQAVSSKSQEIRAVMDRNILLSLAVGCPGAIQVMLQNLMSVPYSLRTASGCIMLLNAGRKGKVYNRLQDATRNPSKVFELIAKSIDAEDIALRISALELLTVNPKLTSIPGQEELDLLWRFSNMSIRCTSTALRQEILTRLGKYFVQMKFAIAAIKTRPGDFHAADVAKVDICQEWLRRVCDLCISSIHPSAVYGKKYTAAEILCMVVDVFECTEEGKPKFLIRRKPLASLSKTFGLEIGAGFDGSIDILLSNLKKKDCGRSLTLSLLDDWDKIRDSLTDSLLAIPGPLKGFELANQLQELLEYGFQLLKSPRLSDSESGAKIVHIVFKKCILDSKMAIRLSSVGFSHEMSVVVNQDKAVLPELDFMFDLIHVTEKLLGDSLKDMIMFAKQGFAHGFLVCIRHLIPLLPFNKREGQQDISILFDKIYGLINLVIELVMPVLSVPEDITGEMVNLGTDETIQSRAKAEQLILSASWINSKEICLILNTIWKLYEEEVAIPSCTHTRLEEDGRFSIQLLLDAKHYGTLEVARELLRTLSRVNESIISRAALRGEGELKDLNALWMATLLHHLHRPDQNRRDAIRRSGGLPFGIYEILFVNSKSENRRDVFVESIHDLLGTVNMQTSTNKDDTFHSLHWPKVHALNTLRLAFSDTRMDSMEPYIEQGMKVTLHYLTDPHWEIRNSAALCLTALVTRISGLANVSRMDHRDQWPTKCPTAAEFFFKYDELSSLLYQKLSDAAENKGKKNKLELNPVLCPILALLGRLKPMVNQPDSARQGGFGYSDYIRSISNCSNAPHITLRKFAAKAIVSVSPHGTWKETCANATASVMASLGYSSTDWNRVHGNLLQLVEFANACFTFQDVLGSEYINAVLMAFESLLSQTQICNWLMRCSPAFATFLKLCIILIRLDFALSFHAREKWYRTIAVDVIEPYLDNQASLRTQTRQPMEPVALKRAARFYFMYFEYFMTHSMPSRALERVQPLLLSNVVEIQLATLKYLSQAASPKVLSSPAVSRAILESLDAYKYDIKLQEYLFATMNRLFESKIQCCSQDIDTDLYLRLALESKKPQAASEALILACNLWLWNPVDFSRVLETIYIQCLPEMMEDARHASAKAISILHLLKPVSAQTSEDGTCLHFIVRKNIVLTDIQYLRLWEIVFRLLEDEESEIRSSIAASVWDQCFSEDTDESSTPLYPRVEKIQEMAVTFITLQFPVSNNTALVSCLIQWVCPLKECMLRMKDSMSEKSRFNLFEEEKANQHEDPLIMVNIAAQAVCQLHVHDCNLVNVPLQRYLEAIISLWPQLHKKRTLQELNNLVALLYPDVYRILAAIWACASAMQKIHLGIAGQTEKLARDFLDLSSSINNEDTGFTIISQYHIKNTMKKATRACCVLLGRPTMQAKLSNSKDASHFVMLPQISFSDP